MQKCLVLTALLGSLTTLVLSAGCSSEKSSREVATDYCATVERCDSVDFYDAYSTIGECADELQAEGDYARETYGEACYKAGLNLYDCIGGLSCSQYDIYWDSWYEDDPSYPCRNEDRTLDNC